MTANDNLSKDKEGLSSHYHSAVLNVNHNRDKDTLQKSQVNSTIAE